MGWGHELEPEAGSKHGSQVPHPTPPSLAIPWCRHAQGTEVVQAWEPAGGKDEDPRDGEADHAPAAQGKGQGSGGTGGQPLAATRMKTDNRCVQGSMARMEQEQIEVQGKEQRNTTRGPGGAKEGEDEVGEVKGGKEP